MAPGGARLLAAPGGPAIETSPAVGVGGAGAAPLWTGLRLSDVAPGSLAAWWDAGALAGYRRPDGSVPTIWGGPVGLLADLSGNARPAAVSNPGPGDVINPGMTATPRQVGALGGLASISTLIPDANTWPMEAASQSLAVANADLRASAAWSLTCTWSRPNLAQAYQNPQAAGPVPVLQLGGATLLALANNSVGDTLKLFPGGANVSVATGLSRAFTLSVTLVNRPGAGVDVWVDDTQVATAVPNPLAAAGPLTLPSGPGQVRFHEGALWSAALDAAAVDRLHGARADAAAKRWARARNRKTPTMLLIGQSNASNFSFHPYYGGSGGTLILGEAVRYHLGALACCVLSIPGSLISGTGAIASAGGADILVGDPAGDAVAGNYPLGTRGQAFAGWVTGQPADRKAMVAGIVELWTENATAEFGYASAKAVRLQQERQMLARYRAAAGANIPRFGCYMVPYPGNDGPVQGLVEQNALLEASDNVFPSLSNFSDTLPQGASYDAATGAFGTAATGGTAGDNAHRDTADFPRMARRMAPAMARQLALQGFADIATWPAGLAQRNGPVVLSAAYEGVAQGRTSGGVATDTLLVTMQHDPGYAGVPGCDVYTSGGVLAYRDPQGSARPSAAAQGAGWVVLDNSLPSDNAAARVLAVACERVTATTLRVVLASRLSAASRANLALARLYYGYGGTLAAPSSPVPSQLGRGGAIYDTYAALPKPAGWDYAGDYGVVDNMALATTPFGVPIA